MLYLEVNTSAVSLAYKCVSLLDRENWRSDLSVEQSVIGKIQNTVRLRLNHRVKN